ncbi:phd finger domain protein [Grosmannia clavigera kw1407]|uniref:Chromatin modification-related protein n=1 Tax=Grosmannia clavigera (strain kw1407 / UAMH 11150) TaxID=655863 RepID=F0XKS5_GROCL|nr:phd finger domain protein [Grosmannia clavigera kw1407]EFX01584.1 phd finger domain protein [Grosmannia clavigera kw1407]
MPRDDLSIDFVKRMPPGGEALDPALILDDWINRVANLPEEIRFLQDEIADRDRRYADCIKIIEERDARIQKCIKANGSHEVNPREEGYRKVIAENFDKAEKLADEKIALAQKMQAVMDRHVRQLDMQIKQLYDRNEPGFSEPDELPSLLRTNAANPVSLSVRSSIISSSTAMVYNPSNGMHKEHASASASSAVNSSANRELLGSGAGRASSIVQSRQAQVHQGHSSSAPASPAASMIIGRHAREGSIGPGPGKRGPRANSSLSNAPATSSGLARHSSLGPGTPKTHHQTAAGIQRAGSAGPRATLMKGIGAGPGRKLGTPSVSSSLVAAAAGVVTASGPGRKKGNGTNPSMKTLSRVKRPKNSATSSTAESELSEADSASESNGSSRRGTPARSLSHGGNTGGSGPGAANGNGNGGNGGSGEKEGSAQPQLKRERDSMGGMSGVSAVSAIAGSGNGPNRGGSHGGNGGAAVTKHAPRGAAGGLPSSDDRMDVDDDEAGDDRKYCLCQNVSFGDMVACDNEDCPFEWFHWSCVGLKSEPNGTWYCPVCTENVKGSGHVLSSTSGHGAGHLGGSGSNGNGGMPATTRKAK